MRIFMMTALIVAFFIGGGSQSVAAGCYPGQYTIDQYQEYVTNVADPSLGVRLHKLKNVMGYVDFINNESGADYKYPFAVYYFTNEKNNLTVVHWIDRDGCIVYEASVDLKNIATFIKMGTAL